MLAYTLGGRDDDADLHIILNMYDLALDFDLPPVPTRQWHKAVDTSLPSPADIADPGAEEPVQGTSLNVGGRSVVVLVSKPTA